MVEEGFEIVITPVAEKSTEYIYAYFEREVSRSVTQRIKNEIFKEILSLKIFPERKSILRSEKDYSPKYGLLKRCLSKFYSKFMKM